MTEQAPGRSGVTNLEREGEIAADFLEKLLDIARNEKDAEVRKDAIFWISRSKDPRATKLIEDLLNK